MKLAIGILIGLAGCVCADAQRQIYLYDVTVTMPRPPLDTSRLDKIKIGSLSTGDSIRDLTIKRELVERLNQESFGEQIKARMRLRCSSWEEGQLVDCLEHGKSITIHYMPVMQSGEGRFRFSPDSSRFIPTPLSLIQFVRTGQKAIKAGLETELWINTDSSWRVWLSPQLDSTISPIGYFKTFTGGVAAYQSIGKGSVTEGVFVTGFQPSESISFKEACEGAEERARNLKKDLLNRQQK